MSTYQPNYAAPAAQAPAPRGFIATLFDFTFRSFLAPTLIRFLYALSVVVSVLITLALLIASFSTSHALGALVLIVSPLLFLVWMILFRVSLELTQVFFALESHAAQQLHLLRNGLVPPVLPRQ